MKGFQASNQITVDAPPERVWAVLQDSTLLTQWAPMVKHTTGKTETVGSTRRCQVEWQGRDEEVVERCVEAVPSKRIAWVMEEGGMKKWFSEIRFGFMLEPSGRDSISLTMEAFYRPKGIVAHLMYALMMRRMLHRLRKTLLGNLKTLIEQRDLAAARNIGTVSTL